MRYTVAVLDSIAPGLWVASQPLRFFGLEIGSRMTVIRLASGGLVLHSPVRPSADVVAAVDALGPVAAIVAPTKFHHLSVAAWVQRYPAARVLGCPGLIAKREDVSWNGALADEPDALWDGQLEQVHFAARSLEDEVVFYHRASQTMICADAIFNFCGHDSWLTRCVGRAIGLGKPGAGHLERVLIRQRDAARGQVDRMLAWDFDRMVVGHGPVLTTGAKVLLERAYAWL